MAAMRICEVESSLATFDCPDILPQKILVDVFCLAECATVTGRTGDTCFGVGTVADD